MPAGGGRPHGPSRAQIIQVVLQECAARGIPSALVLAIIEHESNFQAGVVNTTSGAIGLMQLMPATARALGVNAHKWRQNIEGGVKLLDQLHSDNGFNWFDTLRAYAAGVGGMDSEWAARMAREFTDLRKKWASRGYTGTGGKGEKSGVKLEEDSAALFIAIARRQLGEPYVWGAEGPNQFDCSGLIDFAANKAGLNIPRSTADGYYGSTQRISRDNLRAGDLVFFNYGRLGSGSADHVGIYVGGGQILDTRSPEHPVMIRALDWENTIGFGRIAGMDKSSTQEVRTALRGKGGGGGFGNQSGNALGAAFGGDRVSRQELRGIMRGFGLNPDAFNELITQAIQQQWSEDELAAALYDSEVFKRMFPGIFNADGSLKMTAAEWQRLAFGEGGYADIGKEFGIKLNRNKIGALIEGNKSPDEWAFDARVMKQARSSEAYRLAYSSSLKAMGQDEVSKKEWFDWIAGTPNSRIENLYEAANLQTELQIGSKAAVKASRQIGEPGEQIDIQDLVNQVRQVKAFIEPELAAAGVSDADLAVLRSGADPKNLQTTLQQILNTRQALVGQRLTSASPQQGGGLYPELTEAV